MRGAPAELAMTKRNEEDLQKLAFQTQVRPWRTPKNGEAAQLRMSAVLAFLA
jgi:hypothetical protein